MLQDYPCITSVNSSLCDGFSGVYVGGVLFSSLPPPQRKVVSYENAKTAKQTSLAQIKLGASNQCFRLSQGFIILLWPRWQ